MFRYWAMALEADFDEFGYTDASDIEIESEILELGDDYEAPEPEFQRRLSANYPDPKGQNVPLSHPAVLPSHAQPPTLPETVGSAGVPGKRSEKKNVKPRATAAKHTKDVVASQPSFSAPVGGRTKSDKPPTQSGAASSKAAEAEIKHLPPRKTPAKEQIAPLSGQAGKAIPAKPSKSTAAAKKPSRDSASKKPSASKPAASAQTTPEKRGNSPSTVARATNPARPTATRPSTDRKSASKPENRKALPKATADRKAAPGSKTSAKPVATARPSKRSAATVKVQKGKPAKKTATGVNPSRPLKSTKKSVAAPANKKRGTKTVAKAAAPARKLSKPLAAKAAKKTPTKKALAKKAASAKRGTGAGSTARKAR